MTPANYLLWFNRPNFRGLTDKYLEYGSKYGITPMTGVMAALAEEGPVDVIGGAFSEHYRDLTAERLTRYRYQWRFYNGNHFENPWEDGEQKLVINFCKSIVDKAISFFIADGWKVKATEGNEQIAQLLNMVWDVNDRLNLSYKMLQYGGVNGDCFVYVTVATEDEYGNPLPKDQWHVKLVQIDPKYCYPFFSRNDPNKIESILMQFPATSPEDSSDRILYSLFITPDTFDVYLNENKISSQPNPFGRVNVVFYKNTELANSFFGEGDLDEIIPLNENYNLTANSVKRIIKYHGEPTTVIFGARASDMERGAKKIWSNLPKDAKVENLQLQGSLTEATEYLKGLEDQIYKIARIPKIALETSDTFRISNTSGIAIQMLFQPLVEKINIKRINFSKAVREVNELILIAEKGIIGTDVEALADNPDAILNTTVDYTSPLPKDRQAEIDEGLKLVAAGIWSKAEMIRRLADVQDFERLALELVSDKSEELMESYEAQRAALGKRPNPLVAFLGSPGLSEDLQSIAQELASLQTKKKQLNAKPVIPKKVVPAKKPKTRVLTSA